MSGLSAKAPAAPRDYAACSGCGLCVLVCPMWRGSHDPRLTPEGLAKGLQAGATVAELAGPIEACSLCGACDPVCPERIDLSGLIMDLRLRLPRSAAEIAEIGREIGRETEIGDRPRFSQIVGAGETAVGGENRGLSPISISAAPTAGVVSRSAPVLLPGPDLRADAALLARVQALLGLAVFDDDGADIALALELGVEIPQQRLHGFLDSLRGHTIVAADGLLLRQLRRWLPGSKRMGLGPALSTRAAVRSNLAPSDLYVIEPRAFHGDYERMVGYYDRLQRETGCSLSLDLQRIAVPASSSGLAQKLGFAAGDDVQAKWLLQGRKPARIVVESLADRTAFERVCELPVVHLAELGEDPQMLHKFRHAFG